MEKDKLAIVHFQPLELYPPVMNMVDFLSKENRFRFCCFTTSRHGKNWYNSSGCRIYRFGKQGGNPFMRYLTFLEFNIGAFIFLLLFRPEKILYYETYSSFPVFLYKKFFRKTQILIHNHEYVSPAEIRSGSIYFKFLIFLERFNIKRASWISHTNEERLQFFLADNKIARNRKHNVLKNYPPKSWIRNNERVNLGLGVVKRVVYVGSVSLSTLYIQEFAWWIKNQNGKVLWDIYTNQNTDTLTQFLAGINCKYIRIWPEVKYFDLPDVLKDYDYGVILYKAHIKNVEYCAPNKLFEYLSSGLKVIYPCVMSGCKSYEKLVDKSMMIEVDFNDLKSLDLMRQFDQGSPKVVDENFSCDEEYKKIVSYL